MTPEVPATTTTSLVSKCELEVVDFGILTRLPPPPPPSCPNVSRGWSIWSFRRASNHHHLPHIETRAGGGSFRSFDVPPTTTSLTFKREPEVVIFVLPTHLPPPPPPWRSNASRRWFFSAFRPVSHHHHLPRIQTRAGGGHFRRFDVTPTTTSLASKCKPEVVLFIGFDATPTTTSLTSNRKPEVVLFGSFNMTPTTKGYKGGGGAKGDDDLLVVVLLINDPPSIVKGFLLWP